MDYKKKYLKYKIKYYAMRDTLNMRQNTSHSDKKNKYIKNGVIDCSIIHPSSIEFVNLLKFFK